MAKTIFEEMGGKYERQGDYSNQRKITHFRSDTSLSGRRNGYEPGK